MKPSLEFRPLWPVVSSDNSTTLDLLITVRSPENTPSSLSDRPPLNLALVIDRSASMAGSKLSYARKSARYLVNQLTHRDRLAIVTFDEAATVVVPSQPVHDPLLFISAINSIQSGCGTDLFAGWIDGAMQVANHLDSAAHNRVLLLSDGEANQGLTESGAIAAKVGGLTQHGITTSAFGLGRDFDEDLLGALATAGGGTLAHIESPRHLPELYSSELNGLAETFGSNVSICIRTKHGAELVDVLNDLPRTGTDQCQLPDLHYGQEFSVGVRLEVPAWIPNQEITSVHLAWDDANQQDRQELTRSLTLPVKPTAELLALPPDLAVAEQLALLRANRDRRRAIEALDAGEQNSAKEILQSIDRSLEELPQSEAIIRDRHLLDQALKLLKVDENLSRKKLRTQSLRSSLNVYGEIHETD